VALQIFKLLCSLQSIRDLNEGFFALFSVLRFRKGFEDGWTSAKWKTFWSDLQSG
jgi:hypothetical protein